MKKSVTLILSILFCYAVKGQWYNLPSGTTTNLEGVHFVTPTVGYVVGGVVLLKTTDAGANWLKKSLTDVVYDVYFHTPTNGWFTSSVGNLYKTTDGGNNWSCVQTGAQQVSKMFWLSSQVGFVVADTTVYKTTDGGLNWVRKNVKTLWHINNIYFLDNMKGFMVGGTNTGGGCIYKTTDGGETWTKNSNMSWREFSDICFFTPNVGIAVGVSGTVVQTTDGGLSWIVKTQFSYPWLTSIALTDTNTAYVTGLSGKIIKTTDQGNTWAVMTAPITWQGMLDICFPQPERGFAVGESGTILKLGGGAGLHPADANKLSCRLFQNPFQNEAFFFVTLSSEAMVELTITNSLGQTVAVVSKGKLSGGEHTLQFNTNELANGVYFFNLLSGVDKVSGKMIIAK